MLTFVSQRFKNKIRFRYLSDAVFYEAQCGSKMKPKIVTTLSTLSVKFQCLVFLFLCSSVTKADVIVITQKTNYTVDVFADLPASFGTTLPSFGLKGFVVMSSPANACSSIEPPPQIYKNNSENVGGTKWFVLIRRFDCSFVDKVRNAQAAGYVAAIIHNVGSNVIEPMAGDGDSDDINISAIFIGQDDGLMIKDHYQYDMGYKLIITNELPFNINSYLLPFAIVVSICFGVMLIFMIVKCIKDRRRMRRYRLPTSLLKKIPSLKFKKGEPNHSNFDTCAICLEDYVDGDKLRVLPCSHAYHCKCIDPWLTRNRRVCPVCKRRVLCSGETLTDSESEAEDETRPLLRPGSYGTQGGTFSTTPDAYPTSVSSDDVEGNETTEHVVHEVHIECSQPFQTSTTNSEHEISLPESEDFPVANQSISDDEKSTTPIQPVEDTSVYFTPSQQNTSHQTPDV